jgi:hypothetical protein
MSQDYDMLDKPIETAIDLIMAGNGISESIDAVIMENDLTPGETRSIIYFMAQKGYRYQTRGA